jgi:endonuclease/exonuclease/phosphatase (EEP) superfamily protein YafD
MTQHRQRPELWHSARFLGLKAVTISRAIATCVIWGALLATIGAELGNWLWVGNLLESFRSQYVLLLGTGLVGACLFRRPVLAIAALLGLGWNLVPVAGYLGSGSTEPSGRVNVVRIVSFNAGYWNEDVAAISVMLRESAADVVVLMEVPTPRAEEIFAHLPEYAHRHVEGGGIINGSLIYSKWPILQRESIPLGKDDVRAAFAAINVRGRTLNLFATHLHWPTIPALQQRRDAELRDLAREAKACRSGCVIVGDLNISTWTRQFRDFISTSGMQDCARGHGLLPTWPAQLWKPLRIRIDHCVAGNDVHVIRSATGGAAGSDHLPTISDLALPASLRTP